MRNFAFLRKKHIALGRQGENFAADYLERNGFTILARNWRTDAGELDIVALDGRELVFVEVKTLRRRSGFTPATNLSANQRRRNRNAAKVYLKVIDFPPLAARFDLVEVVFIGNTLCSIRRTEDYLLPLPPGN